MTSQQTGQEERAWRCHGIRNKNIMSNNINLEENGDNGFNSNCVGFDYDG